MARGLYGGPSIGWNERRISAVGFWQAYEGAVKIGVHLAPLDGAMDGGDRRRGCVVCGGAGVCWVCAHITYVICYITYVICCNICFLKKQKIAGCII